MRLEGVKKLRKTASDAFWRFGPVSIAVVIASYVLGKQVVRPHHRMIKAVALLVVLAILLRFQAVQTIYFFIILLPFPSGIVLTSTNVILMTLIPLLWIVRAQAARERIIRRTPIDAFVILFVVGNLLSFFNVEDPSDVGLALTLLWRQFTAIAFFYLIVTLVDDEKKLETVTKVVCLSAGLLALTAVLELVAPGRALIPGWIHLGRVRMGTGTLGYRLEGLRTGGAVGSHSVVSDYCTLTLFFQAFYFLRSRNPLARLAWLVLAFITFGGLLTTANRGAVISFAVGFVYVLWVFRKHLSLVHYVLILSSAVVVYMVGEALLVKYTLSVSVTDRILGTYFVGGVPEARVGAWQWVRDRAMEHFFIGHGLAFRPGVTESLVAVPWPHNAYLFYLYTIGVFGLSSFLIILYKLFRMTGSYSHELVVGSVAGKIMGLLRVSLVMFVLEQGRTDHQRTGDTVYIFIAWMLFGLICAASHLTKSRIKSGLNQTDESPAGVRV